MHPEILAGIVQTKTEEVRRAMIRLPLTELENQAHLSLQEGLQKRGFVKKLQECLDKGNPAVIAEIKKASPSKGILREKFDVKSIAASYAQNGAAALSVLTDELYFQGMVKNLDIARNACDLPILRKDFIVDPYQVYESKVYGANCILLILSILEDSIVKELEQLARSLEMDVLLEVHNAEELERALILQSRLIGINNRDLRTFKVSLSTTFELVPLIPKDYLVVTESGILCKRDVEEMTRAGVKIFLVGEAFMKSDDCGEALRALFEGI